MAKFPAKEEISKDTIKRTARVLARRQRQIGNRNIGHDGGDRTRASY